MISEILSSIGLSPNEAKIYDTLLELKSASINEIGIHAHVHRRNVYDAIKRLMNKGLVYQVLPKKILTYAPIHPDKLQELLDEKMKDLRENIPEFISKYERNIPSQAIYVYKGIGGLKNYINLVIKKCKGTLYSIGGKGSWFDPRLKGFMKRAGDEWRKKKLKSKIIYDSDLKGHISDAVQLIGKDYKFLDKKYSTNSSVEIFGDYVIIYSGMNIKKLEDDITIFVLKDKTLARDYLKWFFFMWDHLPKGSR